MVMGSQRLGMWEAQEWIQEFLIYFRKQGHSQKGVGWISEQKEAKSQRQQRREERERNPGGDLLEAHGTLPTPPSQPHHM